MGFLVNQISMKERNLPVGLVHDVQKRLEEATAVAAMDNGVR